MSNLDKIEQYQKRINNFLIDKLAELPVNDTKLLEAMRYGLLIGGKRMRPYLAYISGEMLGASHDDIDGIAAALEEGTLRWRAVEMNIS